MSLFKGLFFGKDSIERIARDLPIICFTVIGALIVQQLLKEELIIDGKFLFNILSIVIITFGVISLIFFIYYLIYKGVNPPPNY